MKQKLEELKALREQRADEIGSDILLSSCLKDQLYEVNLRIARNLWAYGVVLPAKMAYIKAAGDLERAAREIRGGAAAGIDRAMNLLEEAKNRVDEAARRAAERAAEKEKQLAEQLEQTRVMVGDGFKRAKDTVLRAASETSERAREIVLSAFERTASRLRAAAGRCREVLAGCRSKVNDAIKKVKEYIIQEDVNAGTHDKFEEERKLVMALPEMQALRSVAFGEPYVVDPGDVVEAMRRDRQFADENSWEAQRFKAVKEYVRAELCQKAEERLASCLSEEDAKKILERLVSVEKRVAVNPSEKAMRRNDEEKINVVDHLVSELGKDQVSVSL